MSIIFVISWDIYEWSNTWHTWDTPIKFIFYILTKFKLKIYTQLIWQKGLAVKLVGVPTTIKLPQLLTLFDPPPPLFTLVCFTYTPLNMRLLWWVTLPLHLKKSSATLMNFWMKNQWVKTGKRINFFVNSKQLYFLYTVIYSMTIKIMFTCL